MQMNFPKHKAGLTLTHNEHLGNYQTVEEFLSIGNYCEGLEWKNKEQREMAIKYNELWTLNWYPDTPVGSYSIAAPTLEKLLEFANEYE